MKRTERLFELAGLLQDRRRLTVEEIARRFDVSPRTAYRDLESLGGQLGSLVRDEDGYRLEENPSGRAFALTRDERRLLETLLQTPPLEEQPLLARRLEGLAAKLRRAAGPGTDSPPALSILPRDRTGPVPEPLLRTLEEAIDDGRTLTFRYRSLSSGTDAVRTVDPYALFHRAGAWYLVAHSHRHHEPRIYRLDRIRHPEATDDPFTRPPDFDLDAYLSDSWSIYRGDRLHEITLRFTPAVAPLVLDGHHHPSEEVEELPDGSARYRVTLTHLDEIARWVLGFGGEVVVEEPEELVERVVEMAEGVVRGQGGGFESTETTDRN